MATWVSTAFLIVLSLCFRSEALLQVQIQLGFYSTSCPLAEVIVKEEVAKGIARDTGVAAGLVRLHFHDCFVRVSLNVQCYMH